MATDSKTPSELNPQGTRIAAAGNEHENRAIKDIHAESMTALGPTESAAVKGEVIGRSEGDEGDDDEEDVDEDGFPIVKNTSKDIRTDLETLLKSDLEYKGSFAFSHTYSDAPNPLLTLSDLGTFGLPLSPRDAQLIKTRCIQAPFGKGERTVVDTEVRDTWEMDAKDVTFRNLRWQAWMDGVVGQVCQTLGVNAAASLPRAELYKLLLYEPGSHFLPHVDTEKANGMFATIVVVLPSEFTGGQAHVSHGGQSKVFDSSSSSLLNTAVLAWYTDVIHEIKPITSGYRLALAYNLIHTTNTLRPALTDASQTVARIRHVLLSWKQGSDVDSNDSEDQAPDKIIFMLDHQYSQANLSASALKSRDAHIVAILDTLARELGFCLGLANVEHRKKGYANDDGCGYYRSKRGWYDDDDDDDDDEDNVDFAEVEEENTTIEHLVDLDGEPIQEKVEFDDEVETIPPLSDFFEEGDYDDQEYEGYMGNGAGSLERFYRRTALIIWPKWGSLGGGGGGDRRAAYALETLQASLGIDPTSEEVDLFNYLLSSARYLSKSVVIKVLCPVARRWKHCDFWIQPVKACGGEKVDALLSIDEVIAATSVFGFSNLIAALQTVLTLDPSNASRFEYLERLCKWLTTQGDETIRKQVEEFVVNMRCQLLEKIQPPRPEEVALLTDQAGTIKKISEILLPQLKKLGSADVLDAFAAHLHSITPKIASTPEGQASVKLILGGLLAGQLEKTDFFAGVKMQQPATLVYPYPLYPYHCPPQVQPQSSPHTTFAFIKKCTEYGNPNIGAAAVERLLEIVGKLPAPEAQPRAEAFLLPLIPLINGDPTARTAIPDELFRKLGQIAVQLTMDAVQAKGGKIERKDVGVLLDAAMQSGNAEVVSTVIISRLKALPWNEAGWKDIIEELHHRQSSDATPDALRVLYETTSEGMIKTYAEKVTLNVTNTEAVTAYVRGGYGSGVTRMLDWRGQLDFCLRIGGPACLQIALERVLRSNLTSADAISNRVVPLLKGLPDLAKKHKLSLLSEPFASTIKRGVNAYMTTVLGPRPSNTAISTLQANLSRYGCTCHECQQVKKFLRASTEQSARLDRIGAPKRKHIEGQLNTYARGLVAYDTIRTSPQGLIITKSAAVHAVSTWTAKQTQARQVLNNVGATVLQQFWGAEYQILLSALEGDTVTVSTLTAHAPRATVNGVVPTSSGLIAAARATPKTTAPSAASARNLGQASRVASIAVPGGVSAPAATYRSANQLDQVHPTTAPAPLTPSKRKANDTIDLCTPSPEPKRLK